MTEQEKPFSSEYYRAKDRVANIESRYTKATDADEKERLEFIAFVEAHLPHLKAKFSKTNNYNKQECLLYYIDDSLYSMSNKLYKDKTIRRYLSKRGFLSPGLYVIIDTLITVAISVIAFYIATGFGLQVTLHVVILWIIGTLIMSFLADLTTYMDFYKVHK